jgi:hypothetical protein
MLSFTLLTGACGSKPAEKKDAPKADVAKTPEAPKPEEKKDDAPKAPEVAPTAAAGVPAAIADVAKFTPAGTEAAFYIDFSKVRTGPLWAQFGPMIEGTITTDAKYQEFVKAAGWDPMKNITGAYIAASKLDAIEPSVAILIKASYDAAALSAAIEKDGGVKETYNNATFYKLDDVLLAMPAAGVILLGDPATTKAAIDASAKAPFEGQADLSAALSAADATKTFFGGVVLSQQQKDQASAMEPAMKTVSGVFFSADATAGIELKGGIRFTDEAGPAALKTVADKQLAELTPQAEQMGFGEYAKKLTIAAQGKDLTYSFALNADETTKLLGAVTGMLGGMMGGAAPEAPVPAPK